MVGQAINGLKQCGDLSLLTLHPMPRYVFADLLKDFASSGVNIFFATTVTCDQKELSLIAVSRDKGSLAHKLAITTALRHGLNQPEYDSSITALSLYPRGPGLALPVKTFDLLFKKGIAPLSMGTSLAALILIIKEKFCGPSLKCLSKGLHLPSHAAPPDASLTPAHKGLYPPKPVWEIVSAYKERPIFVYHLRPEQNVVLLFGEKSEENCLLSDQKREKAFYGANAFFLNSFSYKKKHRILAAASKQQASLLEEELKSLGFKVNSQDTTLFHLQGPHFGDRPGIAFAAVCALEEVGIRPLALTCVVHSLFFAVPMGKGAQALKGLARHFCTPE